MKRWVSVGLSDVAEDQGFSRQGGGGIFLDMGGPHLALAKGDCVLQYHICVHLEVVGRLLCNHHGVHQLMINHFTSAKQQFNLTVVSFD